MDDAKAGPRIAQMLCVRDEEDLILDHLLYHRALGVEHALVYLDRCTDRTFERIEGLPWVTAIDRPRADPHMPLATHQESCASDALQRTRASGMDWLLHLDADEFAFAGNPGADVLSRGSLKTMLAAVAGDADVVIMETREAVPVRDHRVRRYWDQDVFQVADVLRRAVLDPTSGQVRQLSKWMGHRLGKSLVRTSVRARPLASHTWCHESGAGLRSLRRGWHYHFLFHDAATWQAKYRKLSGEGATWRNGQPVPFPKQAWKQASMRFDAGQAAEYFDRWVAIPAHHIAELLRSRILLQDPSVRSVMQEIPRGAPLQCGALD